MFVLARVHFETFGHGWFAFLGKLFLFVQPIGDLLSFGLEDVGVILGIVVFLVDNWGFHQF